MVVRWRDNPTNLSLTLTDHLPQIHCETGISTSYLVLAVYMMVKKRLRLQEILDHITKIRRQVQLAPALALGLKQVQQELDDRKLQRLESRLRKSHVISLGF